MDGCVTNIDGSVDLPSLAGGVESTVEASVLIPSRPETRRIPSGFRDPPARAATFNQTLFTTTRSGSLCEKEVEDLAHHGLSLLLVAAEI